MVYDEALFCLVFRHFFYNFDEHFPVLECLMFRFHVNSLTSSVVVSSWLRLELNHHLVFFDSLGCDCCLDDLGCDRCLRLRLDFARTCTSHLNDHNLRIKLL